MLTQARQHFWHLRHGGLSAVKEHRRRTAPAPSSEAIRIENSVTFEPWPLPRPSGTGPRVAVILDDFSRLAFSYEWQQIEVTPDDWKATLAAEPVDLLFVESAWNGNSGAWQYHLTGANAPSEALTDLLAWCKERSIPTVFWNKEDPTHHDDFLPVARLFDQVFTTDADLLDTYRDELGHDRVAALPFAASTALHNPIRSRGHQDRDVAFAGMYFAHRHPERRTQMELLLGAAVRASAKMDMGLEIFSRQLGGNAEYQFPAPFDQRVVGTLPYDRMLTAYRAYKAFLNVNTVVGSSSMCARRVFEITASGTPVVSTASDAITKTFAADEVFQVIEPHEAEFTLRGLVNNPEVRDRAVHKAQRRIWSEHTYTHRADQVLTAAGLDVPTLPARPAVSALVSTIRPEQLDHVLRTLGGQEGVDLQLVLLTHGWTAHWADTRARAHDAGIENLTLLHEDRDVLLGECLNRLVAAADAHVIAKIDDDDVYGSHYLLDQVHALRYSRAEVVGKHAHFVHLSDSGITALRFADQEHRYTTFVSGPTIVTTHEFALSVPFEARTTGEDSQFLRDTVAAGGRIYSADRFNFAQVRRADGADHTWTISDAAVLATATAQAFSRSVTDHVNV